MQLQFLSCSVQSQSREQKHVTKKLAEFHNSFALVCKVLTMIKLMNKSALSIAQTGQLDRFGILTCHWFSKKFNISIP